MGHDIVGLACNRLPTFLLSKNSQPTSCFASMSVKITSSFGHYLGVPVIGVPASGKALPSIIQLENDAELNENGACSLNPSPLPQWKWRLVIAYDGTKYAGWQYQKSPPTIQSIVERALTIATKLGRDKLGLVGSGRTDAGVHAWGQVAHFMTPFPYASLMELHSALNGILPSDIRVRELSPAPLEFHARCSAKSKIYHYKIYTDAVMDPFQHLFAYHCAFKLNVTVMKEAAKHFIGQHDFSAFSNAPKNDKKPDPMKEIFRFDVVEMDSLLRLEVEGSGFLYRQVRNMVSLLIQIGKEALPSDIVPKILATCDRRELAKVAATAPPHGLCLMSVNYNEEILQPPPGSPTVSFGRNHQLTKYAGRGTGSGTNCKKDGYQSLIL